MDDNGPILYLGSVTSFV